MLEDGEGEDVQDVDFRLKMKEAIAEIDENEESKE